MLGTLGFTPPVPGIEQFLATGTVFDRATLGITPPYTRLDLFSPIITVSDGATLGYTTPAARPHYPQYPVLSSYIGARHTQQRVICWGH